MKVASIIQPGVEVRPLSSASLIIVNPMRSFTEPPGFRNSILAYIGHGALRPTWLRRTRGGLPIASRILSYTRRSSELFRDGDGTTFILQEFNWTS